MDEAFEIEAQALAQVLDELDYFQVLKIGQNSSPPEIKSAYYRESRAYHPDRFSTLPAGELKDNIGRIYKRINEAYVCLRDDTKRTKYLADVLGPERQKKLRFVEAS
jgi:DnaJ-class molecular chaperone